MKLLFPKRNTLLDSGYALFYGRDSEHRITAVSNATFAAHYAYANGYVTGHTLTLSNGNTLARVMMRDPHRPSLLTGITNLFNGAPVSSLVYAHDIAGRVTNRNDDAFGYNARSEVTNAVQGADNYAYCYDSIGNRVWSAFNAVTNTYTANCLNQYTLISNQVNQVNPVQTLPTYDADGNMRWDGRMWHTWDAENRLVHSEPGWVGSTNGAVRVVNSYDHRHRRIQKRVEMLSGRGAGYPFDPSQAGTWNTVKTHTFVYDGWNLVLETVAYADGSVDKIEYVWGLDLSGTLQGAGGVGGLLFEVRNGQIFIPCYDANGNVTAYVDAYGNVRAHYEYSPFGETIAQSGDLADTFTHRFSTKYYDKEMQSYYFGRRQYAPKHGHWFSRDPVGETGGINLYGMTGNNPINVYDFLGLSAMVTAITDKTANDDWAVWELFFGLVPINAGEIRVMATVSSPDDFINLLQTTYVLHGEITRVNLSGHGLSSGTGALASTRRIDLSRLTEQQRATIRKVLAPNAGIFVYSCNAASGTRYFTSQSAANLLQTCIHAKDGLCAAGPDMGQYWNPSSNKVVAYFERLKSGWVRFTPKTKHKCDKDESSVEIKFITEGQ